MKKMGTVMLAALLLSGCDQVQAAMDSRPSCHDPRITAATTRVVIREAMKQFQAGSNSAMFAGFILEPDNFSYAQIIDETPSGARSTECSALMRYAQPLPDMKDSELLSGLALYSGVEGEVLGIQRLRGTRPPALSHPPEIVHGESLTWPIYYEVITSSDGKEHLTSLKAPVLAAITDFMRYYVSENLPNP